MALTTALYIAELETERDVLQAKLKAIADVTDFTVAGSLPNASGPMSMNHGEFYDRWQRRLKTINEELAELREQDVYMAEYRGST